MKRPGSVILFIVLLIGLAYLFIPRIAHWRAMVDRHRNLELELRKLKTENATLENEIKLLRLDPVYLEKIARTKFKKARENEIVYKVVKEVQVQ